MDENTQTPAPKAEPFVVTDDLLRDLDTKKVKMSDLPRAERDAVMAHLKTPAGAPAPESEPTPAANVEEKPKETPAEPKALDLKALTKAAEQEAVEANSLEQKRRNLEEKRARKEKAKRDLDEATARPAEPVRDLLGDEHQTKLAKQNAELAARIKQLEDREAERDHTDIQSLEAEVHKTAADNDFLELEDAQKRYDVLKTKIPIRELNERYAAWLTGLVEKTGVRATNADADETKLRTLALDKWHADQEMQKSIPQIEEMDKLNLLLTLHSKKQAKGGTIRGHFKDLLEDDGTIETIMKRERLEGAREAAAKTISALQKQDTEIQTLSPTDGAGGTSLNGDMTLEKAKSVITRALEIQNQRRLNPQEAAERRKAMAFLSGTT